jgi:hypothetical protein
VGVTARARRPRDSRRDAGATNRKIRRMLVRRMLDRQMLDRRMLE